MDMQEPVISWILIAVLVVFAGIYWTVFTRLAG